MPLPIADTWFRTEAVGDGITLIQEPNVSPLARCNIWHVRGRDRDMLVDTGLGIACLREAMGKLIDKPIAAVATHSHFDHIGSFHEFDTRLAHRREAAEFENPTCASLYPKDLGEKVCALMAASGHRPSQPLIDTYPFPGYDPATYAVPPAPVTEFVEDGDIVDLGDRTFKVLHLPGHSPGSIGLWELKTGIFFSGDAIYDGAIFDFLPDSNVGDYIRTMQRLHSLPVRVVHGGHDPSFDRNRMVEIIDGYLHSCMGRKREVFDLDQ